MLYCSNCGNQISADSQFCESCGAENEVFGCSNARIVYLHEKYGEYQHTKHSPKRDFVHGHFSSVNYLNRWPRKIPTPPFREIRDDEQVYAELAKKASRSSTINFLLSGTILLVIMLPVFTKWALRGLYWPLLFAPFLLFFPCGYLIRGIRNCKRPDQIYVAMIAGKRYGAVPGSSEHGTKGNIVGLLISPEQGTDGQDMIIEYEMLNTADFTASEIGQEVYIVRTGSYDEYVYVKWPDNDK